MEDEILDYDSRQPRPNKWYSAIYTTSIIFLVYSFIADIARLPGKNVALLIGLFLLLIITVLQFFSRRGRALFAWFYFSGKVALIAAIYLKLANYPEAYPAIYATFACFALGLISLSLTRFTQR